MTLLRTAPILDAPARRIPYTVTPATLLCVGDPAARLAAIVKESGVADTQDDAYAARRADLDAQFRALPPAGTGAYWSRIEDTAQATALPLEVLARCLRERHVSSKVEDAHRIFDVVIKRIQGRTQAWARHIAYTGSGTMRQQIAEELEQECDVALWQELVEEGPTFLLEQFAFGLTRLQQHVAHSVMQQAGEWTRPGVTTPTRVPRGQTDSIDVAPRSVDEVPLAEKVTDPAADQAFERAELSDLLELVARLAPEARALLYDRFWRGLTQEEIAAQAHVTSKTIYNRLKAILRQLGIRYRGGEEDTHV